MALPSKSIRTHGIRVGRNGLQHKPFNLLRSFALLSLLSISLITTVSATLLLRFLTDHLLQRDAVVSMEFIQSVAEDEQPQLNFSHPEFLSDEKGLGELFMHIINLPDVVRTNVFVPDGHIIWSSDKKLVGRRFDPNHDLDEALAGDLVYELSNLREHPKSEYVYFPEGITEFVENYLPIWNETRTEVIGVVEIYKLPRILFQTLDKARWLVWVTAIVGGLFLYATLFWIVHRASLVMSEQQERLVESETITALGEMAAGVAHSIRNSLASIRSSAELAIEIDDLHTVHDSVQDIVTEADRLGQWVRELLLFSHPEDGGLEILAIDEVLRDTLDGFSRIMEKQGVEPDVQVRDPVPPVQGDVPLLGQMFTSLISNAIEAMPDGGRLGVSIAAAKNGQAAELIISDTGQGIAGDRLDKVFKPFFTSKSGGLGLGLSLVQRIVERHHGVISISSQESQGTTIRLDFPRAPG
ncbi:MAG: ATP-binding protein [Pseudomonadota bacterium]